METTVKKVADAVKGKGSASDVRLVGGDIEVLGSGGSRARKAAFNGITLTSGVSGLAHIPTPAAERLGLEEGDCIAFAVKPGSKTTIMMAYVPNPNELPAMPMRPRKNTKGMVGYVVAATSTVQAVGMNLSKKGGKDGTGASDGSAPRHYLFDDNKAIMHRGHLFHILIEVKGPSDPTPIYRA